MRVAVTGGTGLIGRAFAADLAKDGHEIIVLSRDPKRASGLPRGVRIEGWDALTADGWGSLADGADAIVNLAGESIAAGRWTPERKRRIRESRLNAGRAVVQAIEAATHRPGVVIQASGVGYYGPCGDEEVTEETPPGDDFLAQLAIEWEASSARVQELGVRLVIIRFGSGRQWFPWIHIADEVGAIRFLIENEDAGGPFNLAAPNVVTNAEFSRHLGRELGRPVLVPMPAFALRLLLGQMATAVLDGQRAVPQRLVQMGFIFRFPEVDVALRDLLR